MSVMMGVDEGVLEILGPISKVSGFAQSYRGIALLYELLKERNEVNEVYYSRKHICAVFNERKSLIVVDNVPFWAHPETLDLSALLQALLAHSSNIPHIFSLHYTSPMMLIQLNQDESSHETLTIVHEDGEISSWDWVGESWKWISSGFGKLVLPPRVFASHSSRRVLHVVMPIKNRFYWIERIIENEEALKSMKDDPKCQSYALLSCEFQSRFECPISTIMAAWKYPIEGLWEAPQNGLWIRFQKSISRPRPLLAFFTCVSSSLTPFNTKNDIIHFIHHPTTLEMITIDSKGQISLIRSKSNAQLLHIPLSSLSFSQNVHHYSFHLHHHTCLIKKDDGWEIFDLRSGISILSFSWPSNEMKSPYLWSYLSRKDTSYGFWNEEGIWRVKSMPIGNYANILAQSSSKSKMDVSNDGSNMMKGIYGGDRSKISPQMSAAMISRDWAIPRLEAKYLMDILIDYTGIEYPSMRETITFVMACDRMVLHLQSPIVLISILEEANMSSYACNITRQFIDTCLARHQSGMSVVSQNEVDMKAFQLFTTFNTDTIHLLRKFVEIGSDISINHLSKNSKEELKEELKDKSSFSSSKDKSFSSSLSSFDDSSQFREELLSIPSSDCGKMELSYFYLCLNRCPQILTSKLLEFGGFGVSELNASSSHIWPCSEEDFFKIAFLPPIHLSCPPNLNPILLREEERATHPDFFAALSFLLYQFHPQWLLPFVDCLILREGFTQGRSMLPRRALNAIPPFQYSKDQSNGKDDHDQNNHQNQDSGLDELRLLARIGLLVRAQRQNSALYSLLEIYRSTRNEKIWRMILYSIDSKNEDDKMISTSISSNSSSKKNNMNIKSDSSPSSVPSPNSSSQIQKTRTELLTTLLMFCLDPSNQMASNRHFKDIFSRFSSNVTAMDLTTSIRQEYARIQPRKNIPVLVTDENAQMSISTLRHQLARLSATKH